HAGPDATPVPDPDAGCGLGGCAAAHAKLAPAHGANARPDSGDLSPAVDNRAALVGGFSALLDAHASVQCSGSQHQNLFRYQGRRSTAMGTDAVVAPTPTAPRLVYQWPTSGRIACCTSFVRFISPGPAGSPSTCLRLQCCSTHASAAATY